MGRLLGPDANARMVYIPGGTSLGNAAGRIATVYTAATGTTLADIRTYDGTSTPGGVIAGSQLTVDVNSYLPLFWFPDNVDTVYVEVAGGPRVALHADYDTRIDRISGGVDSPLLGTGITYGAEINVNGANPKAIDIGPFVGYIVDNISTPGAPTTTRIARTTTTTVVLDAAAQLRLVTWFLMDSAGTIIQQATRPTNTQRRTHLQLGETVYDTVAGVILIDQSLPVTQMDPVNQLYDLMYSLGPFNVSGNVIASNGASLTFTKTAGVLFAPSFNYFAGPLQTNDPHVSALAAQNPVTFRHLTQLATGPVPTTTILDVANYDVGGVVTPVGGGINTATIFRVFGAVANATADQIYVQYGQATYSSLAAAQSALHQEAFAVHPGVAENDAILGYIVAIRTATALNDPAQASFHPAAKFERP